MEYRWLNKNVNVQSVIAGAERILTKRNFAVSKEESKGTTRLIATYRTQKHETKRIRITISKTKADLSIKFEAGEDLEPMMKSSQLIGFLGGGALLLKKLKNAESYQRLEEDFWRETEEIVADSAIPTENSLPQP